MPPARDTCEPFRILVVDDEKEMCISLSRIFDAKGYRADYETDPSRILPRLQSNAYDLLLLDIKMPRLNGIDLLHIIRAHAIDVPIIMITGHASFENALLAMKFGAQNVYRKPIDIDLLLDEIGKHAMSVKLPTPEGSPELFYQSDAMQKVIESVKKAASSDVPVLITGETGTGKELVADFLHRNSKRAARVHLKLNCAAIPETLLESELFGYEKGAFTGAGSTSQGIFEASNGGSLFLDEIGDMSLNSQAKILRVLQEGAFSRVGGTRPVQVDVRIISATNRDIAPAVQKGMFREDLYYRLSVITIEIPPLRNRKEDIPFLSQKFISTFNAKYAKTISSVSPDVMEVFLGHNWPGNVRELKNCVERAVIYCETSSLQLDSLPSQYRHASPHGAVSSFAERTNEMTKEIILGALHQSEGSRQKAAELLRIDRKTLYNNMKKLGLR
jgi:two-component system, NtrC family, response regulator AtoC